MNYVILNGKKSTNVKGLLISELPPITKPLMRTSVEEIDGRDGDIVTELGYKAYDKKMTIGLFGFYDVDEVIEYFASEGTVIFSNEPDKYYKYKIVAQIDFERLIRFKKATVTFHVQPFKYSAVDEAIFFNINKIKVKDYTETKNDVTVSATNGVISITGTATASTEIYVPINPMALSAGDYTLEAITSGSGESLVQIRVVGAAAYDTDSFGGQALALEDDGEASLSATLADAKTFNYVWLYIASGAVNFTLNLSVVDDNLKSLTLVNRGNIFAKPTMTIFGSGTVEIYLNGSKILILDVSNYGYITIDAEQMNAYHGDTLMNRHVIGDYEDLALKIGTNILLWVGNVTQIVVENSVRWV